jgi:hypothetical protein
MSECTSSVSRFDGHGGAPEQYRRHRPMQHWMLPLGDYLLRIALAAARATANKTTIKKWANFAGHFDGRGGAPVQYRAHCPIEEVQGFGRRHWMLPSGKYCGQYMLLVMHMLVFIFSSSTCKKRSQVDAKAPVFNRAMTYQTKEKGLTKASM